MRRAVLMIIDGLRSDMVNVDNTPHLAELANRSRLFTEHRSVFPSATRVSSASIATGCLPANHGLAGNAIALDEGRGLVPVSVGPESFLARWNAAGYNLQRPTLADRVSQRVPAQIYSNSSPGAAHMQDPRSSASLFHRSGSRHPGFASMNDDEHLDVSYDAQGDRETTRRLVNALHAATEEELFVLWICEPDHSQHALELGSAEHLGVLKHADACLKSVTEAVDALRDHGDEVLFMVGSDHGHETVNDIVPVTELLIEQGFKQSEDSSDLVLASSGMGALIYLSEEALAKRDAVARWLSAQSWTDAVFAGDALRDVGQSPTNHLALAFAMAKGDEVNRFGIPGVGAVAADPFSPSDQVGYGQHGGMGYYETRPLLVLNHADAGRARESTPTQVTDIAPTIAKFLLLQDDTPVDGQSLI